MTLSALGASAQNAAALRLQQQRNLFDQLSGGNATISFAQFQSDLQNLPRPGGNAPANPAAATAGGPNPPAAGTPATGGTAASALQNAVQSLDADQDGAISRNELAAGRPRHAGGHHHHRAATAGAEEASATPGGLSAAAAALVSQVFGSTPGNGSTATPGTGSGGTGAGAPVSGTPASGPGATGWPSLGRLLSDQFLGGDPTSATGTPGSNSSGLDPAQFQDVLRRLSRYAAAQPTTGGALSLSG